MAEHVTRRRARVQTSGPSQDVTLASSVVGLRTFRIAQLLRETARAACARGNGTRTTAACVFRPGSPIEVLKSPQHNQNMCDVHVHLFANSARRTNIGPVESHRGGRQLHNHKQCVPVPSKNTEGAGTHTHGTMPVVLAKFARGGFTSMASYKKTPGGAGTHTRQTLGRSC